MSIKNANTFKSELLRTYLEGTFPSASVRLITKANTITIIVSDFFTSAFSIPLDWDTDLNTDFENVKDDNGVSVKTIEESTDLAHEVVGALGKEFQLTISPWWDSETTVKCNRHFELNFNCKKSTIKINGCTTIKESKTIPLSTDPKIVCAIVKDLIVFYTDMDAEQMRAARQFEDKCSNDYLKMMEKYNV
jgi:hypothetical protein